MWLSQNFERREFSCRCKCGFNTVDAELLAVLTNLRTEIGKPIAILSGCRCQVWNKKVGGSVNSQHLYGKAADIIVLDGIPASYVATLLDSMYPHTYGIGLYNAYPNMTHIDVRPERVRWKK